MTSRLAARNGGRLGLAVLVIVLLLGLALRLDYAWRGRAPVFDAASYARIAANLDRDRGFTLGEGATQAASNYSPGLPLFVAGIYKLSGGAHARVARLLLALIGALSVLFAYLIGRRLAGPAAGLVGAAAVAVYPAFLEYQGMLMSEPLAASLLSGAVLSMLWADEQPSPLAWLLPGVLLGATAMARPEYLAVAFVLAAIAFGRGLRAERWRPAEQAGMLLAGLILIVIPWTIRNAVVLDRFVPISTGGGQVLFAGAYITPGGDPEKVGRAVLEDHPGLRRALGARYLPPGAAPTLAAVLARLRLEQILAALAAQRYPEMESDEALSRMGRELVWEDVTERPLSYAGFLAAKVARIWAHGPRDVMREPLWEALHWALVGLGLLGLALLAWQRRWEALVLAAVFLSITLIATLLVASPRRVLVMVPLVAPAAGVGASWLWATAAQRRPAWLPG